MAALVMAASVYLLLTNKPSAPCKQHVHVEHPTHNTARGHTADLF